MGLTGCLSIPHRATDAGPWTKGCCDAEVELLAFDFACVRHRGDVQVTADTANDLIAAQGGTADVGVFATGEAQTVARVEVGFLLSVTFPIKIALADVHADVDAYALRAERQARLATTVVSIALTVAGILRRPDVQLITSIERNISPSLDLSAYQVDVVAGVHVDIPSSGNLSGRRTAVNAILGGNTVAAAGA
ncbi:hypothetical protein PFLU4_38570 [Pseudomonas fluorescens]|nr:hypothetical protein PFLU4_38570 [Pseudomonas fluorescens]